MAHHQEDQEDHRGTEDRKDREDTVPETVVSISPIGNQTKRIHKTAAGDTGRVGRHKAEEVFQSLAAAAGRKEIGDEGCKEAVGGIEGEGCREAADSLEGQAKMTQEVYSGEEREKKNQDEAEEGNRGKPVVDNKDRT